EQNKLIERLSSYKQSHQFPKSAPLMPELPEVQTVVNDLVAAGLPGAEILRAEVFWDRSISAPGARDFCRRIAGRRITAVRRRAKYIVFDLSGGCSLLLHLRMSGRLHLQKKGSPRDKHEHVVLGLADGRELRLHDTRKFGRLGLVADAASALDHLGPEPLSKEFTQKLLGSILHSRRRMLKPLLLDQGVIAGLGNIYVDEALWEAGLHPCRSSDSLSAQEVRALHRAIPRVLKRGLKNLGTTLGTGQANFYSVANRRGRNSDQLKVFRRTGQPCPRCRSAIERIVVGQRSTHVCPQCQVQ
ncbi:bifunctional DNA-formamidopyrimidine glycosylase/DNA-(apurinic or apyrimidinic site) lyase, partial [Thermodesulfobacteriota bacterium]